MFFHFTISWENAQYIVPKNYWIRVSWNSPWLIEIILIYTNVKNMIFHVFAWKLIMAVFFKWFCFFLLLYRLLYNENKVFLYQLFEKKGSECTTLLVSLIDNPSHMLCHVVFINSWVYEYLWYFYSKSKNVIDFFVGTTKRCELLYLQLVAYLILFITN